MPIVLLNIKNVKKKQMKIIKKTFAIQIVGHKGG